VITNTKLLLGLSLTLAAVFVVSVSTQNAYAHALMELHPNHVTQPGAHEVQIVLGHTNEPTFGALPGIHDGKHNMEVFLEDLNTALPIGGASLTADMYYFKDYKSFKKASSLNKADDKELNVPVKGVYGDTGHYLVREVQKPGIYGYTLKGTVTYFDGSVMPIAPGDPPSGNNGVTVFCKTPDGDTSKFNTPGWFGSYGCTEDIRDIMFPDYRHD